MKKYVITSDWHFRLDTPSCRNDNYLEAQLTKQVAIINYANENGLDILMAGDLFHKAQSGEETTYMLWNTLSSCLKTKFWCIAGNHDLVMHNLNYLTKSSVGLICLIPQVRYHKTDTEIPEVTLLHYGITKLESDKDILVCHEYVEDVKNPMTDAYIPEEFMELPQIKPYKVVICGHNHKTFTYTTPDGRIFVSPGSLMRMTYKELDHRPCFFVLTQEDGVYGLEQHFLDIKDDVFKDRTEKAVISSIEKIDVGVNDDLADTYKDSMLNINGDPERKYVSDIFIKMNR